MNKIWLLSALQLIMLTASGCDYFRDGSGARSIIGANIATMEISVEKKSLQEIYRCDDSTRPAWPDPCRLWQKN